MFGVDIDVGDLSEHCVGPAMVACRVGSAVLGGGEVQHVGVDHGRAPVAGGADRQVVGVGHAFDGRGVDVEAVAEVFGEEPGRVFGTGGGVDEVDAHHRSEVADEFTGGDGRHLGRVYSIRLRVQQCQQCHFLTGGTEFGRDGMSELSAQ